MHNSKLKGFIKQRKSKSLEKTPKFSDKTNHIVENTSPSSNKTKSTLDKSLYKVKVNNKKATINYFNKKLQEFINPQGNLKKKLNKKNTSSKTPLLTSKQSLGSIQSYLKSNKSKKIKNIYKTQVSNASITNNFHLNIKNSNSKPIKLQSYNNINTNKKYYGLTCSSEYESTSQVDKSNKTKKGKLNNNYISNTPECNKKAVFMKNKKSVHNNKSNNDEIKKIFDREFEEKMVNGNKKVRNNTSNNTLTNSYSRNSFENFSNAGYSQSQKNILRLSNTKNGHQYKHNIYNTIYKDDNHKNNNNKNTYSKYYSVLENKIKRLKAAILQIKNEELSLRAQLIDYDKNENKCKYVKSLKDEIEKYKNIIEKTNKACEIYSSEIFKIKNFLDKDKESINKDKCTKIENDSQKK